MTEPVQTSTKKTVGYARISPADQRGTLDDQVARLRGSGHDLDECITEIGSAFDEERPELLHLLADPSVGTIVVEYQDRLSFSAFAYIEAALAGRGAEVIVLEEGPAPRERMSLDADSEHPGEPDLAVADIRSVASDRGNVGMLWLAEDYRVMVENIRAGEDATGIAVALHRNANGVRTRLKWLLPLERGWEVRSTEALAELRELLADPAYDWQKVVLERHADKSEHTPPPDFSGSEEVER